MDGEVALAKAEFARLINASADEIAVFSSVSEATSAVATAFDFAGDRRRVVVTEAEFPTIGHVWLAQRKRGAEVTWVPVRDGAVDDSAYDTLLDERTAVVSATHGYYLDGALQDLTDSRAACARPRARSSTWTRTRSLGTVPVDVRAADVDFLASGNLKFLMGIPGNSVLVCSARARRRGSSR